MRIGNIYSPSDKALFDAINSSSVTNADLRELFLMHGIIISHTTPRKELAIHYSRLVHDFADYQALARLFDTGKRRERIASLRIQSEISIADFEGCAHEVVKIVKANSDAANITTMLDGSFRINVRYKSFNFNKSEFKQLETRDAVISVEKEGDSFIVRGPQNDKMDEICRGIISELQKITDDEIEIDEISLETLPSPTDRTNFFIYLIDNLNGLKKHDVTDVFVYKPKEDIDSEDQGVSASEDQGNDVDTGVHISKASLKGEGVLQSEEMQGLIQRGFYISKIIWQSKENIIGSDIYEFEAQFSEPETCTRFSYLPRGRYKYLNNIDGYNTTKSQFTSEEDRNFSKLIEAAASSSLRKLTSNKGIVND